MNQDPALLQSLFEHTPDTVLAVSPQGVITACNAASEALLGRPLAAVLGRSLVSFVPEEQVPMWLDVLGQPGPSADLGLTLLDGAGHRVPVGLHVLSPFGAAGVRLVIAQDQRLLHDLKRQLETTLLQLSADKEHLMLAALAGAAAHELNQPLTSVLGYAELLRRKVEDSDPMASQLDVILQQAERMAELVRKIGRVSKYETKSYVMGANIVDLDKSAGEK